MGRYLFFSLVIFFVGFSQLWAEEPGDEPSVRDLFFVIDMSPPMAGAVLDATGKYQYSADHDHRKQVAQNIRTILNTIDTSGKYYVNFVTFSSDIRDYRFYAQSDSGLFEAHKYIDSLMGLEPSQFSKKTNICRMLDILPDYLQYGSNGSAVYLYLASSQQVAYGPMGSMCLAESIDAYCDGYYVNNMDHYWVLLENFFTPTQQYNISYGCNGHAVLPYQGIDKPLRDIVSIKLKRDRFTVNVRNDSIVYRLPVAGDQDMIGNLKADSLRVAVITNWHPQISSAPDHVSLKNGEVIFRFRNMLADTVLLGDAGRYMGMIKLLNYQDEDHYYNFVTDTINMELRSSDPAKANIWPLTHDTTGIDIVMPEERIYLGEGTVGDTLLVYLPIQFNKNAIENRSIVYFKVIQEDGYFLDTSEVLVHVNNYQRHWIFELDAFDFKEGINYVPLRFVVNGPIGKKKRLAIKLDRTELLDGGVWLFNDPLSNNTELRLEFDTYYYPLTHIGYITWLFAVLLAVALLFLLWFMLVFKPVFTKGYLYFYVPELTAATQKLKYKHAFVFSKIGSATGDFAVKRIRVKESGKTVKKALLTPCPPQYHCMINGQMVKGEQFLQNFDEVLVISPDTGKEVLRFVYNDPKT